MGAACTDCGDYQQQLNTQIIISKEHFVHVQNNVDMFDQIQRLTDNKIHQDFLNYQFYKKSPDTFFIGSLQDNINPSFGILYKPGQTLYYGNFLNGHMDGKGSLKLIRQHLIFQGEFKEGKPLGKGQLQNTEKTFIFDGLWKESTKPFSGVLKLNSNKTISQIEFINFQHGDAQIHYKNGSFFKGFIDKKTLLPHGNGKMEYSSGDFYQGEWANGKFQGMGTYNWRSGQKYNGQYFEGLRSGEGTFYYLSKKYFTGVWKNGKKQGYGKFVTDKGQLLQKGIYHNDIFDKQQSQKFLMSSLEKAPRDEVISQLMDQQVKEDLSLGKKNSGTDLKH